MYDKLKKIFEAREHVLVEDRHGDFFVFSSIMDCDGDLMKSGEYNNAEEAKRCICENTGGTEDHINTCSERDNWKIIDVFDTPQERFKVGDKVVVCDNAEEECEKISLGFDQIADYIGEIGEVVDAARSYVIMFADSRRLTFPHSCLSYPFKEEEKEEYKLGKVLIELAKLISTHERIIKDHDVLPKDYHEGAIVGLKSAIKILEEIT